MPSDPVRVPKRLSRRGNSHFGRIEIASRPVLVFLPRSLYNLIKADADECGETVEQWIIAEAEAAFEETRKDKDHV